jgi:hypothetical protein
MFKFNPFNKQSKNNAEGGEGAAATDNLNAKGPAADEVKPDDVKPDGAKAGDAKSDEGKAEEAKKDKWYWGTAAKVTLGVVGAAAVVGVGFVIANAMRASENEAVAAVGEAVAAGAEAVADATGTVVEAVAEAAFRK